MLFDERKYFATRQPVAVAHHHLRVHCFRQFPFTIVDDMHENSARQIKIMFAAMSLAAGY